MSDSVAHLKRTEWSKYLPSDFASMVARSSTWLPFRRALHLPEKVVERICSRDVDPMARIALRPHRAAGCAELVKTGRAVQHEGAGVDPRRRGTAHPGAVGSVRRRRMGFQEGAHVGADVPRPVAGRRP